MLLGYIWLLGTFVNSSCGIKINVNIVQNCCRNLAVRGLNSSPEAQGLINALKLRTMVKLICDRIKEELPYRRLGQN